MQRLTRHPSTRSLGASLPALMLAAALLTAPIAALGDAAPSAPAGPTPSAVAPSPDQNAPLVPVPTPEQTVELSPFEVEATQDNGYVAQNTTAGSRLNTPLNDTPAPISVFTASFLEDLGATSISDLSNYTLNTNVDVGFEDNAINGNDLGQSGYTVLRVRGLPTGSGRMENYFTYYVQDDFYDTNQVEFSRGPNSILYGIASPGGVFDITTLKADPDAESYSLQLRTGSYKADDDPDVGRLQLNLNQPLIKDKLALRVDAVDDNEGSWRPYDYTDSKRVHLAVRYQPTSSTTVDLEFERGQIHYENPRPYTTQDWISLWLNNGRPTVPVAGQKTLPTGTANISSSTMEVYNPATGQTLNWENMAVSAPLYAGSTVSNQTLNPMLTTFNIVPRGTVVAGPGAGTDENFDNTTATIDQKISDNGFLEIAANKQRIDLFDRDVETGNTNVYFDPNAELPTGAPNPYVDQPYIQGNPIERLSFEDMEDIRITPTYKLNLGKIFGTHQIVALVEHQQQQIRDIEQVLAIVNTPPTPGTPTSANNFLYLRQYVNLNGPVAGISLPNFANLNLPGTGWVPSTNNTNNFFDINSISLATQSSWWNGRIEATAGVRRDVLDAHLSSLVTSAPKYGFTQGFETPGPYLPTVVDGGDTASLGVVFKVNDWLAPFYNQSSNFAEPNTSINIFPSPLAPAPKGKSQDLGLKFTLLGGRAYATIDYYQTTDEHDADFMGRGIQTAINNIWQTFQEAGLISEAQYNADIVNANGYTFDAHSQGWETELVANVTDNWRIYANFSENQTIRTDQASEVTRYLGQYSGYFMQGTNGEEIINKGGQLAPEAITPNNNPVTVGDELQMVNQSLAVITVSNGLKYQGIPVYDANLRTTYDIPWGWLKGVSVGAGARFRARTIVGYTTTGQSITFGSNTVLDGDVAYVRKLDRRHVLRLQLNIDNLLDNEHLIVDGTNSSGQVLLYNFQNPMSWQMTATLEF